MKIYMVDYGHNRVSIIAKPNSRIRGLRAALQKKFQEEGVYGLVFWFDHECGDGRYRFDVSSPYGESYVSSSLEQASLGVMGHAKS